jgi:hypothetical protein
VRPSDLKEKREKKRDCAFFPFTADCVDSKMACKKFITTAKVLFIKESTALMVMGNAIIGFDLTDFGWEGFFWAHG